ncbi:MAG TPA: prepilin-type N-terminal cleavage/methylation domain-containing protein, partial [bacterium]|nr:prepilin-type N-terminal cleavage/methylation domain-containing protein [bacterium]
MLKCLNDKKGFTIIELVIVIGIISILSIIIIPSYHAGQNQ